VTFADLTVNSTRIHLGQSAGSTNQYSGAVAIGNGAGSQYQGTDTVSIGWAAGALYQTQSAIAIGVAAGQNYQGEKSIAIGQGSGNVRQGIKSVAIGYNSGAEYQGDNSVAIGNRAGYNQGANSIVINASGSTLNGTTGTFRVAPIAAGTATQILYYNTITCEISYNSPSVFDISTITNQALFTTSSVTFAVVNATTATITNLSFGNTSTTQVGFAVDVLGGVAGQLLYQVGPNDTGFINTGSVYVGNAARANILNPANTATQQVGFAADVLGGAANQILYQVGANDTGFIVAPTTATTYLAWTGTNYVWQTVTIPDVISPFLLGCL
jgi:hypothetical protein